MVATDLFAIETVLGSRPFAALSIISAVFAVRLPLSIAPIHDIPVAISVET